MDENVRTTLLGALGHVFQPMVRLAIRNGLSFDDFTHGLKRVFVEAAMKDFESEGREITTGRMAMMTGIDRGDVYDAEQEIRGGLGSDLQRMARIAAVLEGWNQDGDFTGPYGIPLELPFDTGDGSFAALVERYAGRIPPKIMLDELRRIGLAEFRKNRKVRLVSRSVIAGKFKPEAIERMGRTLGDLADTLEHNLNPNRGSPSRFERRVYTPAGVDPDTLNSFREVVSKLGQDFLEKLDNWLTEKEQEEERLIEKRLLDPEENRKRKTAKVGVGVFLYEHHQEKDFFFFDGDPSDDDTDSTTDELKD
jgi:hypothetical protein